MGGCCCFSVLLNSAPQAWKSTREGILRIVNKGTPVPYRGTNLGNTSLLCSREPGCQSHLRTERSSQRCSWTPESYTDNCRNSFMPCQKTTRCQFEGDSPSKSRGNILFPRCNRSQRRRKTWKLAGAYEVSA